LALRAEFVVAAGAKQESYERADTARGIIYHQVHPLKLITDWGMAMLAARLLWQHCLMLVLAAAIIPSAVVTILLTQFAGLDRSKHSTLGRYVAVHMTRAMEAARLAG
jgi:hypothetical protein